MLSIQEEKTGILQNLRNRFFSTGKSTQEFQFFRFSEFVGRLSMMVNCSSGMPFQVDSHFCSHTLELFAQGSKPEFFKKTRSRSVTLGRPKKRSAIYSASSSSSSKESFPARGRLLRTSVKAVFQDSSEIRLNRFFGVLSDIPRSVLTALNISLAC